MGAWAPSPADGSLLPRLTIGLACLVPASLPCLGRLCQTAHLSVPICLPMESCSVFWPRAQQGPGKH